MGKPQLRMIGGWWAAALWLTTACLAAPAGGQGATKPAKPAEQQGSKPGRTVQFELHDVSKESRLIEVSQGRSVIVKFNKAIKQVIMPEESRAADILTISPKQFSVNGKAPGSVQVIFVTEDNERLIFDVVVTFDLRDLRRALERILPDAAIQVSAVKETIILTGTVPDAKTGEKALQLANIFAPNVRNELSVAGVQQVLLRVTIAEVARAAMRQLGANGFAIGKDFFFSNQISGLNPVDISPLPGQTVTLPLLFSFAQGGVGGNNTFFFGLPRAQLEVFLLAMRQNNLLRVMAEPTLVAISGQQASFLAGGEIPIPVPQDNNTITIRYEEFGVQLIFRPTVLSNQKIRLEVSPEVSQLDFARGIQLQGFNIPAFSTRRAQTIVEMASGQTMAIAGLISQEVRASVNKLPALGDVPVLGSLFRSIQYQKEETELLVLVTPELAAPMTPDQVTQIPGKNSTDPNDWELFMMAELEGAESTDQSSASSGEPARKGATSRSSDTLIGPFGPAPYEEAE